MITRIQKHAYTLTQQERLTVIIGTGRLHMNQQQYKMVLEKRLRSFFIGQWNGVGCNRAMLP